MRETDYHRRHKSLDGKTEVQCQLKWPSQFQKAGPGRPPDAIDLVVKACDKHEKCLPNTFSAPPETSLVDLIGPSPVYWSFAMARVTVEDCVDKVDNRFELVLLAAHRARSIANGSPITIERENDKNPVIALREIADETVAPDDMREGLIHSIQKNVEVDEPEEGAAPILVSERRGPMLGRDDQSTDTIVDVLTEEQLLRGMESLTPTEPSAAIGGGSGSGRGR